MEELLITKNVVLNGPRTGRLRHRLLELRGYENVVSNWTVNACSTELLIDLRIKLILTSTHVALFLISRATWIHYSYVCSVGLIYETNP